MWKQNIENTTTKILQKTNLNSKTISQKTKKIYDTTTNCLQNIKTEYKKYTHKYPKKVKHLNTPNEKKKQIKKKKIY